MQSLARNPPTLQNKKNLFKKDALDIKYGDASYTFSLFDEGEFDCIDEPSLALSCEDEWRTCSVCDVRMSSMLNSYKCTECGIDKKVQIYNGEFSTSIINNYNTNDNCSQSIKLVGKDSRRYQSALLKTTSMYPKVQIRTTSRQLNRFNSQSTVGKLPIIILKEAADLYRQVQVHLVFRGKGRLGAMGAAVAFTCDLYEISKKPKVIAKFFDIDESYLSAGDKELRKLHADGKIDIPVHHNPTNSFLRQYFEALEIDNNYKPFICALIERANHNDMKGENNSRISTQCAGAIYALRELQSLTFKKTDIVKYCSISKPTFKRYYEFLFRNRKLLNPICVKYDIPIMTKSKKKKNVANTLNMKKSVIRDIIKND
jgi:transcription initiation factor TFIIIB Brf1 subunit/transcription initiation factor TFIIB